MGLPAVSIRGLATALIGAALAWQVPTAAAGPGDVDSSFGRFGVASLLESPAGATRFGAPTNIPGSDVASTAAGRLLVAGHLYWSVGSPGLPESHRAPVLARYRASGLPDMDFGERGVVRLAGEGTFERVAVDKQRRSITAGSRIAASGPGSLLLARFLPDGSADTTFGNGGLVEEEALPPAADLSLQGNGGLLTGGTVRGPGEMSRFVVTRFAASGRLDESFGNAGSAELPVEGATSALVAVQSLGDGGVLVVGTRYDAASGREVVRITRLSAAGEADSGFGTGGTVEVAFRARGSKGPASTSAASVAVTDSGAFAVSGTAQLPSPADAPAAERRETAVMFKFSSNGGLDRAFGFEGQAHAPLARVTGAARHGLLETPTGDFVLLANDALTAAILRFKASGELDTSWGRDGVAGAGLPVGSAITTTRASRYAISSNQPTACGFGLGVARIDGLKEPDVYVRPRLTRLSANRLSVALKGSGEARGRVTAYFESADRGSAEFGEPCPRRSRIGSGDFRMAKKRVARIRLGATARRKIKRRASLVFVVTSRAKNRVGGSSTHWSRGA